MPFAHRLFQLKFLTSARFVFAVQVTLYLWQIGRRTFNEHSLKLLARVFVFSLYLFYSKRYIKIFGTFHKQVQDDEFDTYSPFCYRNCQATFLFLKCFISFNSDSFASFSYSMSQQSSGSPSQNFAEFPKYSLNRKAVSAVILRLPFTISEIRV